MNQRLFLRLGDEVFHYRFPGWGNGKVVEEKNSIIEGGLSLVRIVFEDGIERCFINDMDNYNCCYYTGIRIIFQEPGAGRQGPSVYIND